MNEEGESGWKIGVKQRVIEFSRSVFQTQKRAVIITGAVFSGIVLTLLCIWLVLVIFSDEPARKTGVANESGLQEEQEASGAGEKSGKAGYDILSLEPFEKIPLKNSRTMGYLNLNVVLELSDPGVADVLTRNMDRVRGLIEKAAGERSWFELRTAEGKLNFKYSLIKKLNSLYSRPVVRNLYFTSFLMQ